MSVSVFFSNNSIQVVIGKSKGKSIYIDRLIEAPMPENAILNGVVIEGGAEAISTRLKEIWSTNKIKGEAGLVINSPQFIANRVTIPVIAKSAKATDYINKQVGSDEFGRFTAPIKGWYPISINKKEKTQEVLSEVAERTFIEKYIKIFSDAGITLGSVHDGVSLATEMLSHCIKNATAIYMIRDAQMLVTILYENGNYYYNSTRRLFQQPGTEEFAAEIRSTISGIRQFANSQRLASAITDVYFAGMSPDDVGMLQASLTETDPDITVHGTVAPSHIHFRKWNDKLSTFVYPIAGLIIPKTGLSLLKAARSNDEGYTQKKELTRKAVPVIVLSSVLALIAVFLGIILFHQTKRLDKLTAYNSDPSVMMSAVEYDRLVLLAAKDGEMQGGVDLLQDAIASYPVPDSSVNDKIRDAARGEGVDITINSYDAANGIFSITAYGFEVEKINRFIANLLSMDIFEDVNYTGYEWNENNGTWSIKVICTLAAGDKEVEE
ncbi:MAG: hypothetical protein K6G43_10595 [Lachnospiraceae bacterium]|nr:hypothetical protein [Lachnospiraceae bacterium]